MGEPEPLLFINSSFWHDTKVFFFSNSHFLSPYTKCKKLYFKLENFKKKTFRRTFYVYSYLALSCVERTGAACCFELFFSGRLFPYKARPLSNPQSKNVHKRYFSMFCFHKKKLKIFILKLAKYILSSLHGFTPYHSRNISLGVVKMFQYANKILINFVSIQNDSRCFFIL